MSDKPAQAPSPRVFRDSTAAAGAGSPSRAALVAPSLRRRHRMVIMAFVLVVALPFLAVSTYLYAVAADQYASTTGFVVRKSAKGAAPALDFLGGVGSFTGASSTDAKILYEYIQSQQMVELVDRTQDLRKIFSKPGFDPVFAFGPGGTVEDLTRYWRRMVRVHIDNSSGLLELRVLAFDPRDALRISREVVRQSSVKINELSAIARNDATRYAREDLEQSLEFLKGARQAISALRSRTQAVDPQADIQAQMGLIGTLQSQLAQNMIELDLMKTQTIGDDPKIREAEQRIKAIENRISAERRKIGIGGAEGETAATEVIGEYERLQVNLDFAEQSYLSALSTYNSAQADATRQNIYLATYIDPTLAEAADYPRRFMLSALAGLFLFLIWAIGSLIAYSAWDRR